MPSPQDSILYPNDGQSLQDSAGNSWSLGATGAVLENGNAVGNTTANTLVWNNNLISIRETSGSWEYFNGSSFLSGSDPLTVSPNNSAVVLGLNQSVALVDSSINAWTLTTDGHVDVNGQAAGYTANVVELADVGGVIEQENSAGNWYSWTGSTWSDATQAWPLPTNDAININSNGNLAVVPLNAVGTIAVDGDVFDISSPGNVTAYLGTGSQTLQFLPGTASASIVGGDGADTVIGAGETNRISTGSGSLDVTGGAGASTYFLGPTKGRLTIEDFSAAKGDRLLADPGLNSIDNKTLSNGNSVSYAFASGGSVLLNGVDFQHQPGVQYV